MCPIGLGDSIMMAGAAVVLSQRFGKLRVPTSPRYIESVKSFYVNHPEIEVYAVEPPIGQHWGRPPIESFHIEGMAIMCGHYLEWPSECNKSFAEWMYAQLEIDYRHRWDSCPIPLACESVKQIEVHPTVFVHEDAARGFTILKSISKDAYHPVFGKSSMLEHACAIRNAGEIHCIDSSMYHLIECLDTNANLFLHRYSRCYRKVWFDFPSRKKWNIVTCRRGDWKEKYERVAA